EGIREKEESPDSGDQDEERQARRIAEEEELKRLKAAAELAEREEKLLFMMTKGAAGKLQPSKPEDTDVAEGDEGSSGSLRGDDTEDIDRAPGQPPSSQEARAEAAPTKSEDCQQALDDDLLNTIELLMEAYSAKEVEGRELLEAWSTQLRRSAVAKEPFSELLEVLKDSEKPTDQEIKAQCPLTDTWYTGIPSLL
ncbi:unnamed protein product, partial [Symbiodinium pilosum]